MEMSKDANGRGITRNCFHHEIMAGVTWLLWTEVPGIVTTCDVLQITEAYTLHI